ncbi:DUF3048 domain-containing protein [Tepidibacillus sp. HK-1]|uniref:DUF3048 domain-containing protein n=1 Tax=Tepidibacillus sp. HK-1 TaxID=1883407 RepID=UPI000852D66D|nr:DUF3048 domain-containing protein [Tepidibacillus sp. HK-1]GBF10795.1 putative lipoprotein YerB precursor [Tepidibacillus sp. HK-1]
MKRFTAIIVLLMFVVQIVGCSNQATVKVINEEKQIENKTKSTEIEKEEVWASKYTAPLTGLHVDNEVKERIIGVMVNNHPKARPQSGLIEADMVYEILAEGMITRFVAFYQSKAPKVVGPVRSIRPYYIDLINGFDGLIVHAGASEAAYAILQRDNLPDLDEIKNSGPAFWRVDFRKMPHNLYTSIDKIRTFAEKKGYRSEGYIPTIPFLKEDEIVTGTPAKEINIEYYSKYIVGYQYDETKKQYNRYINGQPHTDLETEEQLTAKNLLVIRAEHKILDNEGRRSINLYGPGKGYLFQNGAMKEITWERKDGVIRAYVDGKEQGLLPGQTWTIVVQNSTPVSYQ